VTRLKLGVIFGSSRAHRASVESAQAIAQHLDLDKYEPFWIGITEAGAWKLCEKPRPDWEEGGCRPVVLPPDKTVHGLLLVEHGQYTALGLDVVFPVLHCEVGTVGARRG
jgi:D-alanine---(R)-lactate ligase